MTPVSGRTRGSKVSLHDLPSSWIFNVDFDQSMRRVLCHKVPYSLDMIMVPFDEIFFPFTLWSITTLRESCRHGSLVTTDPMFHTPNPPCHIAQAENHRRIGGFLVEGLKIHYLGKMTMAQGFNIHLGPDFIPSTCP